MSAVLQKLILTAFFYRLQSQAAVARSRSYLLKPIPHQPLGRAQLGLIICLRLLLLVAAVAVAAAPATLGGNTAT
jgi:hypothetical protein